MLELHEKYYGPQDRFDTEYVASTLVPIKHDNVVRETRKFVFHSPPNGAEFSHTITTTSIDEAYTNIRITPSSAIRQIELLVGGQRMEKLNLYRFLDKEAEFYLTSNGRALPALQHHHHVIDFETDGECDITLTYDVVGQVNPGQSREAMIYAEQYSGPTTITHNSKLELSFNHPIVAIYAVLPETTVDARILLDGIDYNLVLTKNNKCHVIEFGDETSINFSMIDEIELKITLSETNYKYDDIHVIGMYKMLIRVMSGMMGAAFTK